MTTTKPKKMKIAWWALTDAEDAALHAVRDGRPAALCGGVISTASRQVTGPKTIERSKKCKRCTSHLERFEMMA